MHTRRVVAPTLIAALALLSTACEKGTLTDPVSPESGLEVRAQRAALPSVPSPTTYSPTTRTTDQAKLCKDASSPAGSYTFNISASNTQAGDQVASSATLSPGQCTIIFNRSEHTTDFGDFANVQITEVIPTGSAYRIKQVNVIGFDGERTVPGPTVEVKVNGFHGAVANYVNEAVQGTPGPVPGPVTAANGTIHVCKSGSVAGSFTFTTSATGTTGTDRTTSSVTLTSGQCQVVFFRPTSGTTSASVTITEGASSTTTLTGATVNGSAATLAGRSLTVTQGMEAGRVIIFTNANNTPGPTPAPGIAGNGQVVVCKAGSVAGSFGFTTSATGTTGTDQTTSSVTLTSGQCQVVFFRPTSGTTSASVTITEGASSTTTLTGATVNGSAATLAGRSLTVTQGMEAGRVIIFTNVNNTPGPTPGPGVAGNGEVVVCKAGTVAGTFNFTTVATGTVGTDAITNNISLATGQCQRVFLRAIAGTTSAALVITEGVNATTTLSGVTVNGSAVAAVGGVVTVSQGMEAGKVIVFTNVNVNVVVSPPINTTVGAGQILVCKTGVTGSIASFTTTSTGTNLTDVTTASVNVTAGTCAAVFLRTLVGTTSASVTITENALVGTTLSGATVNGVNATLVGRAVVVQQGLEAGKIVIFTNTTP